MKQVLNTLYVTTEGAYLRLEGETVVLSVDKEKRGQIPLHHLGSFVLIGRIMMSPKLMERCMNDGRAVVWLSEYGRFQARVEGAKSGNILLRLAQYRTAESAEKSLIIAKQIVAGKLRNSRAVLMRSARDSQDETEKTSLTKTSQFLANALRNTKTAESSEVLLGIEGSAAVAYFSQLNIMIKAKQRETFRFNGRNRRPPRDPVNALLSFLYALVLNDCRSALEVVGLDSQLGFFHRPRPGRPALALDMQEAFRAAIADRLALTLINRGQLEQKDFEFRSGGSVLLNDTGRKKVIYAYQERKKETLQHPLLEQSVEIGLLPLLQARLLARFLRGDIENYIPYLYR